MPRNNEPVSPMNTLAGVEVIDKKAHKSAEESRGKYAERHVFISPKEADSRKEETYRYARSALQVRLRRR